VPRIAEHGVELMQEQPMQDLTGKAAFVTGAASGGVVCDVADAASAAFEAFGNIHVLCNNAGVGGGSGIDDISLETWHWVPDVNLMGVVHSIRSFLLHIRTHGEGGHIINTAPCAIW
jgi:NAD(P)-dependent dehydrogenase (short-subunit alcohol dehydrogenase family)